MVFFFKQKTAYEMRISDWSSDVCSSDLEALAPPHLAHCRKMEHHPAVSTAHDWRGSRNLTVPGPSTSRYQSGCRWTCSSNPAGAGFIFSINLLLTRPGRVVWMWMA